MLAVVLVLMLVPGPASPGWDAAMCLPGRNEHRYFFSACEPGPVDWKGFCEPYKTRFAVRTGPKKTKAECQDVVRQNHPNMWRYRKWKKPPTVCDFNVEGPLPAECYAP